VYERVDRERRDDDCGREAQPGKVGAKHRSGHPGRHCTGSRPEAGAILRTRAAP
jgi:hypothetical protein